MKMHLAAALLTLAPGMAPARPVVLELFTSQSCSSCPPADALLAELATTRGDVLALDFHVDYWNYLSWHDPFSSAATTKRQRAYAAALGAEVFTPQLVVDGGAQVVGSDRAAVLQAITAAQAAHAPEIPLRLDGDAAGRLSIEVGAGAGKGTLLLVGFDSSHTTQIGGGENGGRTLHEVNVVRSQATLAGWNGAPLHLRAGPPKGEHAAILLQDDEGRVLAAAAR